MLALQQLMLLGAGIFTVVSCLVSSYLIHMHQSNLNNFPVQSKIVGILWMVPIYGTSSWVSLWSVSYAPFINMFRDCYEAYVLYLFLALLLSFLNADVDDSYLVQYLESIPPVHFPFPLSICFPAPLPRGRNFLRFCKFGLIQYCIVRPLATLVAVILGLLGLFREADLDPRFGYLYITLLVNFSTAFAVIMLATFYSVFKQRLKPFQPIGKFLCIKFVLFVAFWQGVVIAILVKIGVIRDIDKHYSAEVLATSLQDLLVCFEMACVSFAHLYSFSYKPFLLVDEETNPLRFYTTLQGDWVDDSYDDVLFDEEQGGEEKNEQERQQRWSGRKASHSRHVTFGSPESATLSNHSSIYTPPLSRVKHCCSSGSGGSIGSIGEVSVGFLERHFSPSSAVRDFNETMPVVVLPSGFKPTKGTVVLSDPAKRLENAQAQGQR